ncbi:hypothetical protein BN1708_020354, partial [Verticillium longisporum]
ERGVRQPDAVDQHGRQDWHGRHDGAAGGRQCQRPDGRPRRALRAAEVEERARHLHQGPRDGGAAHLGCGRALHRRQGRRRRRDRGREAGRPRGA